MAGFRGSGNAHVKIRLRDRIRYAFEQLFFRYGAWSLAGVLVLAFASFLAVGTLLSLVVGVRFGADVEAAGPVEAAWHSLTRLLDGGTFSQDEDWSTRASMLLVTLGGMLIVSAFVGVVTEGIRSRTDQWREGRSLVPESNHSLILGWGPMVYPAVSQLCIAGSNRKFNCIVVMSELPRGEMDAMLKARVPDRHGARIVCRRGSPSDLDDLEMVQAHAARSVIVLPGDAGSDAPTIKTVLAVAEEARRLDREPTIIAPIFRPSFIPVARLAAPKFCQFIDVERLICRLEAQAARSPGIGEAITELLSFEGNEIYEIPPGPLVGASIADAIHAFSGACVFGVRTRDGGLELAPDPARAIGESEQLLVVTEDDDPALWGMREPAEAKSIAERARAKALRHAQVAAERPRVRRVVILGWTTRGRDLVEAIHQFSFGGLTLTIVAAPSQISVSRRELAKSPVEGIEWFEVIDDEWEDAEDPICDADVVLVLADRRGDDAEQSDAEVLVNLLRLRHLKERRQAEFRVVTEIVDRRNQELVMATDPDDLIVTGTMLANALTQFIDNEIGGQVLRSLLGPTGPSIFVVPLSLLGLGADDERTSFEVVAAAALARGAYAIGLKLGGLQREGASLVLSPERSGELSLTADDRVVLIAAAEVVKAMFGA